MTIDDHEQGRLTALRGYGILDTPNEPAFDRIVHDAARAFGVPMALISLLDEQRQWFKAKIGIDAAETPRSISFCTHAIRGAEVMVVEDATRDARFAANPWVTGATHIRFYAGAPLITASAMRIGTVCVIDTRPHPTVSDIEHRVLAELARKTVAAFEQRRESRQAGAGARRFHHILAAARGRM